MPKYSDFIQEYRPVVRQFESSDPLHSVVSFPLFPGRAPLPYARSVSHMI
jgi:hypothetical protein